MLDTGDADWQRVTVSALPAAGAVSVSFWCISNHNSGQTWFDDLGLTLTELPAVDQPSYNQFLNEHPDHPLAVEAHLMRVSEKMTQAKWIKEKGFYDPDARKQASEKFAQAAAVLRRDDVLQQAVAQERLAAEVERYERLIDKALWLAAENARAGRDDAGARVHLTQLIERNRNADLKARAEALIAIIDETENRRGGNR